MNSDGVRRNDGERCSTSLDCAVYTIFQPSSSANADRADFPKMNYEFVFIIWIFTNKFTLIAVLDSRSSILYKHIILQPGFKTRDLGIVFSKQPVFPVSMLLKVFHLEYGPKQFHCGIPLVFFLNICRLATHLHL